MVTCTQSRYTHEISIMIYFMISSVQDNALSINTSLVCNNRSLKMSLQCDQDYTVSVQWLLDSSTTKQCNVNSFLFNNKSDNYTFRTDKCPSKDGDDNDSESMDMSTSLKIIIIIVLSCLLVLFIIATISLMLSTIVLACKCSHQQSRLKNRINDLR